MGEHTSIEWTDATFNPWWGCTKISPGCDHCYAEEIALRFHPGAWGPNGARRVFDTKHFREPLGWNRKAEAAGKPLRVFCGSMCDVFDKHSAAEEYRPELFTLIHKTPWLRWQLLTKRIGNVARMVPPSWLTGHWPRNAWIGATVVNQEEADRDVPKLLELPASVRFLSCEPLLGPIKLTRINERLAGETTMVYSALNRHGRDQWKQQAVDWVIVGGESGNNARQMHPEWARSLRDQCAEAGLPFLFKQWGEWLPAGQIAKTGKTINKETAPAAAFIADDPNAPAWRFGKKRSGRLLDGVEHNGMPA